MALVEDCDAEVAVVEAIRQGDRRAFGGFLRRHERWVRGVVFSVLGDRAHLDDVCQQVWTRVWEQAGRLRDARRWRSWLYRLVHNAALDAGRELTRRRRIGQAAGAAPDAGSAAGDSNGERAMRAERDGLVWEAIRSLPALYREPFVLRHLEGWSYERIGSVMGLPENTVETRLVRARRMLREALQGKV